MLIAPEKNRIQYGESRAFVFPMFDFNLVPPKVLSPGTSGIGNDPTAFCTYSEYVNGNNLVLGNEGYWKIWGISATMCTSTASAMADGTDISIQIFNIDNNTTFFNTDVQGNQSGTVNLGAAPIEAVAGKWGNPKLFKWPKVLPPGTQLKLKAAHAAANTPQARSPLYVVLHAQLIKDPVPSPSNAQEKMQFKGEPTAFLQNFTGLTFLNSLVLESPLNVKNDLLITGLCVQYPGAPTGFINSIDPRKQELELLFNFRGTIQSNEFVQPAPCPISLIAGQWGARRFPLLSYYKVLAGGNVRGVLTDNVTSAFAASDKFQVTFHGLMLV